MGFRKMAQAHQEAISKAASDSALDMIGRRSGDEVRLDALIASIEPTLKSVFSGYAQEAVDDGYAAEVDCHRVDFSRYIASFTFVPVLGKAFVEVLPKGVRNKESGAVSAYVRLHADAKASLEWHGTEWMMYKIPRELRFREFTAAQLTKELLELWLDEFVSRMLELADESNRNTR